MTTPYRPRHRCCRGAHGRLSRPSRPSRLSRLSRPRPYPWADILFAAGALATLLLAGFVVGALLAHPL